VDSSLKCSIRTCTNTYIYILHIYTVPKSVHVCTTAYYCSYQHSDDISLCISKCTQQIARCKRPSIYVFTYMCLYLCKYIYMYHNMLSLIQGILICSGFVFKMCTTGSNMERALYIYLCIYVSVSALVCVYVSWYLVAHTNILTCSLIQTFQHVLDLSLKCAQQVVRCKRPSLSLNIYVCVSVSVHVCLNVSQYVVAHTNIPIVSGFVLKMCTTGSNMEKVLSQARMLSLKADAPYIYIHIYLYVYIYVSVSVHVCFTAL